MSRWPGKCTSSGLSSGWIRVCEEVGGLGVVIGHSGASLGILEGNVTVFHTLSFH